MSLKDGIAVFNGATTKQEIPVCVSFVLMHLCNSPKSLMEKKKSFTLHPRVSYI